MAIERSTDLNIMSDSFKTFIFLLNKSASARFGVASERGWKVEFSIKVLCVFILPTVIYCIKVKLAFLDY
jgi:hypothetical protein